MAASPNRQVELLASAIQRVGQEAAAIKDSELCGFFGRAGSRYRNGLLVIGRAVNGWEPIWHASAGAVHEHAMEIATSAAQSGNRCPMQWVCDQWQIPYGYRANSSAFWRVIRSVLFATDPSASVDPNWSSRLAWTNLYKIAPASGGNPSDRLCLLQLGECQEILSEEISALAPTRILFATGLQWVQDFVETLKADVVLVEGENLQARGELRLSDARVPVVVARHPQGKNEARWASEILAAFPS